MTDLPTRCSTEKHIHLGDEHPGCASSLRGPWTSHNFSTAYFFFANGDKLHLSSSFIIGKQYKMIHEKAVSFEEPPALLFFISSSFRKKNLKTTQETARCQC